MKKYLVKTVSKATAENPSFAGLEQISYNGKGEKTVGMEGSAAEAAWLTKPLHPYMIAEYGYNTEAHARRSWLYKNPQNDKFWTSTVEIVSFEI